MREILSRLLERQSLNTEESRQTIIRMGRGEMSEVQAAAFLMGVQQKGITPEELLGFRQGMMELAVVLPLGDYDAIDVCGTGGDGKDTFNISTTAAFIVAGAGVNVAKHGNHGVSSMVGSSTVLEYLGVKFTNDVDHIRRKLDTAGICYLHAPLFHPAMQHIGPIRKELGVKTFFNILGPLLNPAKVATQVSGVSDMATFGLYKAVFAKQEGRYAVIHALDGYDEISLTGKFKVWRKDREAVLGPEDCGLDPVEAASISGGNTLRESAEILVRILKGEGTQEQNDVVRANAGLAIGIAKGISLAEGIALATESLQGGRAYKSFENLIA